MTPSSPSPLRHLPNALTALRMLLASLVVPALAAGLGLALAAL